VSGIKHPGVAVYQEGVINADSAQLKTVSHLAASDFVVCYPDIAITGSAINSSAGNLKALHTVAECTHIGALIKVDSRFINGNA
jgi:hypothetical protein